MKKKIAIALSALLLMSAGLIAVNTASEEKTVEPPKAVMAEVDTEDEAGEDAKEEIVFTKSFSKIKAGKTKTLKVNVTGASWTSSDTNVATVTDLGKVKALRVGKTTISAVLGDQSASLLVKVKPKKVIGIDPGHQIRANTGTEPVGPGSSTMKTKVTGGTRGSYSGKAEYVLNLEVAKKLKAELKDRGYKVVLTRSKHEVDISNKERAQKLNKSCDIAIRLHADGAGSSSASGASALYPGTDNPYIANLSAASKKLSEDILDEYCKKTGISKRGLSVRNDLTGTNWSTIPVTLIEMGFMTNRSDDLYMAKASNQKKMAEGMADGIDKYFGSK
ncbi:MAG: N-acetylmuramoyl-L-alanine amidase [Lachnospiraceae bacterium]|nr:N-acetylmuramoyl-L-alanine amidase [Lachnospiraceae bacterium]